MLTTSIHSLSRKHSDPYRTRTAAVMRPSHQAFVTHAAGLQAAIALSLAPRVGGGIGPLQGAERHSKAPRESQAVGAVSIGAARANSTALLRLAVKAHAGHGRSPIGAMRSPHPSHSEIRGPPAIQHWPAPMPRAAWDELGQQPRCARARNREKSHSRMEAKGEV